MTTPSSTISMSDVNTELNLTASASISLNDSAVRVLAGAGGSGTSISMNMLRGKSNEWIKNISSNQVDLDLRTWAVNNGWNGTSKATITLDSGFYIYSSSTSIPALTVGGTWPNGLTLINNGSIVGRGGTGGKGGINPNTGPTVGGAGGTAISAGCSFSITNNGIIGGGGGGGGGGAVWTAANNNTTPGGGGGGGGGFGTGGATNGGTGTLSGGGAGGTNNSVGGNGGALGASGSTGGSYKYGFFTLMVIAPGNVGGAAGVSIARNGYTVTVTGNGTTYN